MACKVSGGGSSIEVFIDGAEVEVDDSINLIFQSCGRTNVISLPYPYDHGAAVVYNDEIHVLGLEKSYDNMKQVLHYRWDGIYRAFIRVPSELPYDFQYGSAVVYNDEIHILGGFNGSSLDTSNTNHYKWNGTSWVMVSTLPDRGVAKHDSVVYNGEIHIFSWYYRRHYAWNGTSWRTVTNSLPAIRKSQSAVVYNGKIHILGGEDGSTAELHKYHYAWDGTSWSSVSTLPYEFYDGSAVVYNDKIHIMGGVNNTGKHYAWDGTSWSEQTTNDDGPAIGSGNSAVSYKGSIYCMGRNIKIANLYTAEIK